MIRRVAERALGREEAVVDFEELLDQKLAKMRVITANTGERLHSMFFFKELHVAS